MRVFLVPNTTKDRAIQVAERAARILAGGGVQVLIAAEQAGFFAGMPNIHSMAPETAYESCDVVVSVGGDGSLLHAARHTLGKDKPLLGINIGRLGFLTALEVDELDKLALLAKGEYTIERRSMIRYDAPAGQSHGIALNDIVLFKKNPEKTVAVDIFCDDILMSSFRGDGVVFASSTGSTAYSMSAGGPIMDARLHGMIVTQICAHIVHMPPMVLAGDRVVRVVSRGAESEVITIITDGISTDTLAPGGQLRISQAGTTVPLIQFTDSDQLKSIDKKLKGR